MSSNKVVLVLDREDAEDLLLDPADHRNSSRILGAAGTLRVRLRAALQQEGQEARTEYQLLGERCGEPGLTRRLDPHSELLNRNVAQSYLKQFSREAREPGARYCNIRIQSRAVTQSDWIDLNEEEGA